MTERRQTTLMIVAILLASAFVTATTWAGLRLITSSSSPQRSATVTPAGPPVHAYLMPAYTGSGGLPVHLAKPSR